MGDLDVEAVLDDMKGSKPPYKCPQTDCSKSYRSISGISQHLASCSKDTKEESEDEKPIRLSQSRFVKTHFINCILNLTICNIASHR